VKNVAGKRVLITGGAMGMGKIYARIAVEEGASAVVLRDLNEGALKETAEELRQQGGSVHEYVVDVSDKEVVASVAEEVLSQVGVPHVVINNAGIVRGNSYFWETPADLVDAELTMKINSLAPMYVTRAFLPAMIEQGEEARIVNVASAAGFTSNPRMSVYAASKWAAIGWSDSVRLELEQAEIDHVRITTVAPYYIKTGMFEGARSAPLLPLLEPEDVCAKVWKAMRKGKPMLVLPKGVLLGETMKGILPLPARDLIAGRLIGVHRTMEDFTGRVENKDD
jgi:NAD(P)-dependent dehydrogenase (short-subunit alcohol dehydrogenase family)